MDILFSVAIGLAFGPLLVANAVVIVLQASGRRETASAFRQAVHPWFRWFSLPPYDDGITRSARQGAGADSEISSRRAS